MTSLRRTIAIEPCQVTACDTCKVTFSNAERPMVWCCEHVPSSWGDPERALASAAFCSVACARVWLDLISRNT